MVEPPLHAFPEAYLVTVDDGFDMFLDLTSEYFIESFCNNVHKRNYSEILSLCWVWLNHQGDSALLGGARSRRTTNLLGVRNHT